MKDPILATYTTEELLFEYHDHYEREKAQLEQAEQEGDKIESGKIQDTLDWAEQEEKAELEALKKKQENGGFTPQYLDPLADPANKEWVDKQLAEAKKLYGEDFGEDIDTDFGDIDGA